MAMIRWLSYPAGRIGLIMVRFVDALRGFPPTGAGIILLSLIFQGSALHPQGGSPP